MLGHINRLITTTIKVRDLVNVVFEHLSMFFSSGDKKNETIKR